MATAYDVLVKQTKTGTYKKINSQPLSKNKALNFGFRVTDTYKEDTFKLKKTKSKVTPKSTMLDSLLADKFTKNNNVYKEKKKFRKDKVSEVFSYLSRSRF